MAGPGWPWPLKTIFTFLNRVSMPPWLTALLVLVIMSAFGAYIVTEGFATANSICRTNLSTCQKACSSSDSACLTKCSDLATECFSNAVVAESIAITGDKQGSYRNSTLQYIASNFPGMLGSGTSNGYMSWITSQGSSTSIPVYNTDLSRVYRPSFPVSPPYVSTRSPSPSASPSATASASPSASASTSPTSDWDRNRDRYITGWPRQYHSLQEEGSYDSQLPLEGSYVVQVKKWKPHETPTPEPAGVTVSAPTDDETVASEIRTSAYPSASLQQLIRDDVKDTVDALFRNPYEILYT